MRGRNLDYGDLGMRGFETLEGADPKGSGEFIDNCIGLEAIGFAGKILKFGQVTKGVRWMPWRREAMKDVVSCDKLRGAANRL